MADQPENALTDAKAGRSLRTPTIPANMNVPIVLRLAWGLGDVLLATSAVRRHRDLMPLTPIIFQTYTHNRSSRYNIEYPNGCPAEMLYHNPDIDRVADIFDPLPPVQKIIDLRYASFGGPSLDYPIQAHYWENLGLEWQPGQRFDAYYYVQEEERAWARSRLPNILNVDAQVLAISPHGGWAGKMWRDDSWGQVIAWALAQGVTAVILGGKRLTGPPWDQRDVVNLTGETNIRQAAAILDLSDMAVMIEGGMSNLRFALGKPTILLTCATQVGLQIWAPPELTTEIRVYEWENGALTAPIMTIEAEREAGPQPMTRAVACDPCMWRREMVTSRSRDVFPATIRNCPAGRSLRDVPAAVVIAALERAT